MRDIDVRRASAPATGHNRSAYLWWLIWLIWLPLFIPNIFNLLQARPPFALVAVSFVAAAVVFGLYIRTTWRCAQYLTSPTPRVLPERAVLWAPVIVMVALSAIFTLVDGRLGWGALFIYTSCCAAGWLPTRQAIPVVVGLIVFTLVGVTLQSGFAAAVSPAIFVGIPGFVVVAAVASNTVSQRMRLEREELARFAAVTEERLRIARDLHDLLGHSLSVIALKSELAKRLVDVAPERAAAEIGDVESVARTALQEVREAVAGYRQPSLASELAGGREILAAAGISARVEGNESATHGLPPAVESALAWAVREGVTNVIRHSRARSCTIRVTQDQDAGDVYLEITDDGVGAAGLASAPAGHAEKGAGNGLRGLTERMEALGGRNESGPLAGAGFRLCVRVPLGRPERDTAAGGVVGTLEAAPARTKGRVAAEGQR